MQIAMQSPSWCAPDCQETAAATECCVATGGKLGLATGTEAEIPAASRTEASRYSMRARGLAASQTSASRPIADLLHLPAKPRHVLSFTSAPASFLSLLFLVSYFSFSFYHPPLHVVYKTLKTFHRHIAFGCCFSFCFVLFFCFVFL